MILLVFLRVEQMRRKQSAINTSLIAHALAAEALSLSVAKATKSQAATDQWLKVFRAAAPQQFDPELSKEVIAYVDDLRLTIR